MIQWFMLQNRAGKTRLSKFYEPYSDEDKRKVEQETFRTLSTRDSKWANFCEFRGYKLVYRRYAHLYFMMCIDVNDNELAALEAIHLFVEILDHYFGQVTELDIVLSFHQAYLILDEFILAGEIQETSKAVILNRLAELNEMEI